GRLPHARAPPQPGGPGQAGAHHGRRRMPVRVRHRLGGRAPERRGGRARRRGGTAKTRWGDEWRPTGPKTSPHPPRHDVRPRTRRGDGMKPVLRRARAAVVAGAALVLAASCTSGSTDAGAADAGAKGPVIRIAVGVDPSYAPLYLAVERGMFAKAGVNVQL